VGGGVSALLPRDFALDGPDWDAWRHAYPTMSFSEACEVNDVIASLYPEQQHFAGDLVAAFVERVQPVSVIELGGWDGALAAWAMGPSVVRWENWDLSAVPQVCEDPRYRLVRLTDWAWELPREYADLCVASHVLEHLTAGQISAFFMAHRFANVVVDVPIGPLPVGWMGSTTTHILELSAGELADLIGSCGYRPLESVWHDGCTMLTFEASE
jgi:hypothetical protein